MDFEKIQKAIRRAIQMVSQTKRGIDLLSGKKETCWGCSKDFSPDKVIHTTIPADEDIVRGLNEGLRQGEAPHQIGEPFPVHFCTRCAANRS